MVKKANQNDNQDHYCDKGYLVAHLNIREFYSKMVGSIKINDKAEALGLCPFHDDHSPSLSVNLESGLWHCFAGCGGGNLFGFYKRLKSVDLPTSIKEIAQMQGIQQRTQQPRVAATFEYKDSNGKMLYIKERIEPGRAGRSKEFRFKHEKGDGSWEYKRGHNSVLYNLPGVFKATEVFVVEGEGKADLLNEWGLAATCLDSGAGSCWKDEYIDTFKGKDRVVILADNDTPGRAYASRIAEAISGRVGEIKIVKLPGLKEGEDIVDWARTTNNDKERLMELIEDSSVWEPEDDLSSYIVPLGDILKDENANINWLIDDFLPEGGLTLISGAPGNFKTFLAMDIARCLSTRADFLGRHTKVKKVYYIDLENPKPVIRKRLLKLGITGTEQIKYLPQWTVAQLPSIPNDVYLKLADENVFIIFDSLIRFLAKGIDENKSTDMAQVMGFLKKLAGNCAGVLVLHHSGKGEGSSYRGSSDILGSVDMAYTITKTHSSDSIRLSLKCAKNRYGIEEDISIGVISDSTSVKFVDMEKTVSEERMQNNIKDIKAIYRVINEIGSPSQSVLIKKLNEDYEMSRRRTLKLLEEGEGYYWTAESGGTGKAIVYKIIPPEYTSEQTSPPLHHMYIDGEVERSLYAPGEKRPLC